MIDGNSALDLAAGGSGRDEDGESLGHFLRRETRQDHEAVDAAFGSFGLETAAGYIAFLQAHSRILPLAERILQPSSILTDWAGRATALFDDLDNLGADPLPDVPFVPPSSDAARCGAIYVLEGSRLGGAVLQRLIPSDTPSKFLGSVHGAGGWRKTLDTLELHANGPAWRDDAVIGAKALFAAYLKAAKP